jgi:hypothetical protein
VPRRNPLHSDPRLAPHLRIPDGHGGADPFAITKAMGHADIKTTMIYVSLGKSHIREQVERLNGIRLLPLPAKHIKALPAPASAK